MARTVYTREELLASVAYDEPLVAGGVRCHGGFVSGRYVSPRTAYREQAISAWQEELRRRDLPLVDVPREFAPPHYPNAEQAKLLLREGVRDPIVRTLTTIAILEGFGAVIRDQKVPDWRRCVRESVEGTAFAHLGTGLFEAHARDEAGYRHEGGHKQMWEAARDLALEKPKIPHDVLLRLMTAPRRTDRRRLFAALDPAVEELVGTMASVFVIEVFAADTFRWAEEVLGDPEVSARPAEAAAMVGYIRTDERPHVEYLRTALSELRACTLVGERGEEIPGSEVVDALLARTVRVLATERPRVQREETRKDIEAALGRHRTGADLVRKFRELETDWSPPPEGAEVVRLVSPEEASGTSSLFGA
ncbi:MAG: hypothetical protein KatS3mg076_2397 [Candidatus Binatia bacterium]|nr:MAG: hypothetical protein KatS3mg076_2397 [Candidatus Binatia bacterium]